mgnify:CR=1 FL=1
MLFRSLAAAVDRYAQEPFSARTWRVLQGLGDPMLEPGSADSDTWAQQDEWRKITSEIVPSEQDLQNVGWNCRIGRNPPPISLVPGSTAARDRAIWSMAPASSWLNSAWRVSCPAAVRSPTAPLAPSKPYRPAVRATAAREGWRDLGWLECQLSD